MIHSPGDCMTANKTANAPTARRLWVEFGAIFVALPLLMALGLPPALIWWGLAAMLMAAVLLLYVSEEFSWRSLLARPIVPDWTGLAVFVAATTITAIGLVMWLRPNAILFLPRFNVKLWILILCAYPFVSALPQEIVFRALFFGRYGRLFPNRFTAIAANAAVFSLAHLFYWNWPAVILTGFGGAIFAWAYVEKRSFPFAWLLHAIAGQIIFTIGLGVFFFHGAVQP